MSILAASAGIVQATSLFLSADSLLLEKSVGLAQAAIVVSQPEGSKLRPEFSLLAVPVENYYTRYSMEAQVLTLGLPDVRLGLRYTPTDSFYRGFYNQLSEISSTLFFVQGGYSAMPGAGVVYRAGVGAWDLDTIRGLETGALLEASQQEIVLEGDKLEKFRSVTMGYTGSRTDLPFVGGVVIRYSEDRPDISIVRNGMRGEYKYGQDKEIVQCHRKNLDLLFTLDVSGWTDVSPTGWVFGANLQVLAGFRYIIAWEDFQKIGKKRLAGVVEGDSLLVTDGPVSLVGDASAKVLVGKAWEIPHLKSSFMVTVSARAYIAGAEIYAMGMQDPRGEYVYMKDGDTTNTYSYSLRPRTLDVGLQLSWDATLQF